MLHKGCPSSSGMFFLMRNILFHDPNTKTISIMKNIFHTTMTHENFLIPKTSIRILAMIADPINSEESSCVFFSFVIWSFVLSSLLWSREIVCSFIIGSLLSLCFCFSISSSLMGYLWWLNRGSFEDVKAIAFSTRVTVITMSETENIAIFLRSWLWIKSSRVMLEFNSTNSQRLFLPLVTGFSVSLWNVGRLDPVHRTWCSPIKVY